MKTRIREVRRARKMTLDDVARRCSPSTTAQTIGRLETGTRTVSVGWLNRIAAALGVEASDLVDSGQERPEIEIAAILGPNGAVAPKRSGIIVAPRPRSDQVAVTCASSAGDYRAGDEIWCDSLQPDEFARALNRDVLVPRPGGRFLFGRLIGREGNKLHLLPSGAGARQAVVTDPPWIACAVKLVRSL